MTPQPGLVDRLRGFARSAYSMRTPISGTPITSWQKCGADIELAASTITALEAEVERLRAALEEIATSKFQNYENTSPDSYGTGVTDGHRYCGNIARTALASTTTGQKGDGV